MQIAIARNPHTKNPNELVESLQGKSREEYIKEEKLDKAAFALFKQKISENPRVIVK